VKLKRELYGILDQLFQKQGDGDKENNPNETSNMSTSQHTFDTKTVNRIYESMDHLCNANITALRDLRSEVSTRDKRLNLLCTSVTKALDEGGNVISSLMEALRVARNSSAQDGDEHDSATKPDSADLESASKILLLEEEILAHRNETEILVGQLRSCEAELASARTQVSEKEAISSDLQTILKSVRQKCAYNEEAATNAKLAFEGESVAYALEKERMMSEISTLSNQLEQELANTAELTQRLLYLEERLASGGKRAGTTGRFSDESDTGSPSEISALKDVIRELEDSLRTVRKSKDDERQRDLMLRARMKQDICVRSIRRWINMQLLTILCSWQTTTSRWRRNRRLHTCVAIRKVQNLAKVVFLRWDVYRQNCKRLWHAGVTAATRGIYRRASFALKTWWATVFRIQQVDETRKAVDIPSKVDNWKVLATDGNGIARDTRSLESRQPAVLDRHSFLSDASAHSQVSDSHLCMVCNST
jgi:hypothetical protein